jgi:hypothetical protein
LMDEVHRSGFDKAESIIHLFIGGSELHGAKVGATDDLDLYGGLRREAEDAAQKSSLPDTVNVRAISELLAKVHLAAWLP